MGYSQYDPVLQERRAWNAGKQVGAQRALKPRNRTGGPDVLEFVERPETIPGSGQVLVEVVAAGVNFMVIEPNFVSTTRGRHRE